MVAVIIYVDEDSLVRVVLDADSCDVSAVKVDLFVGVGGDVSINEDERAKGFRVVFKVGVRV